MDLGKARGGDGRRDEYMAVISQCDKFCKTCTLRVLIRIFAVFLCMKIL